MKILLVNKFLYPKGGAEIVCLGLAERLRAAGHEVGLFGMADPRNPADPDADLQAEPVDYHARRGPLRKAREALRSIYGLAARRRFERLLARRRPDLVHMHNIYHQLTPAILGPARRRGLPVLMTLHDYKLVCPIYTLMREARPCEECVGRLPWPVLTHRCKNGSLAESGVLLAEALCHRLLRSYERGVTLFSSPSRFLVDRMAAGGWDAERFVHLPNGLPLSASELEQAWTPPPERQAPDLLWVGRMSEEKGLATLLKALGRCRAPLRLNLVGDGPQEPALRALAGELGLGDRVRWLGRLSRQEVFEQILRADGSVLPSEWYENAPLSLLESLALGRATLASRMGGIPEILSEGASGWLFEAGEVEALAALLELWSRSPEERLRRGREAHREVRARFHPDAVFARTLDLYASLVDSGG